jgi:peroxiredoxin
MKTILVAALAFAAAMPAAAALKIGAAAPDFTLTAQDGKTRKLSDAKGKWVVLEWFNKDCPFVRKHYGSKNMSKLQDAYTKKGVVWYAISSSAKGKEGALTDAAQAAAVKTDIGMGKQADLLLDSDSAVARAYGAKTTPHMFIVDPKGNVAYMGAIDDKATADPADVAGARNYVAEALDASLSTPSKPVPTPTTVSYGCSVKY